MAVPARRTSKAKKNKRRTHYKVTAPSVTLTKLLVTTHALTVYPLRILQGP